MALLTEELREQLLENGKASADKSVDHPPVVKLFTPDAGATWLLSDLVPHEPDIAFGLCDLGQGFPELGYVRISELESLRGPFGLSVERDLHFTAEKTITAYADEARKNGRIVT